MQFQSTRPPAPHLLMEHIPHRLLIEIYHGYSREFGVQPTLFVQGRVRLGLPFPSNQTVSRGEERHLEVECVVLWLSLSQTQFLIREGQNEIHVEPYCGTTWEKVILRPSHIQSSR